MNFRGFEAGANNPAYNAYNRVDVGSYVRNSYKGDSFKDSLRSADKEELFIIEKASSLERLEDEVRLRKLREKFAKLSKSETENS